MYELQVCAVVTLIANNFVSRCYLKRRMAAIRSQFVKFQGEENDNWLDIRQGRLKTSLQKRHLI